MDINAIQFKLSNVLNSIDQELTNLLPAVSLPDAGSQKQDQLFQKLSSWQRELDLIARNLSSALQLLDLEYNRVSSLQRNDRYSAAQSVTDRIRNLEGTMHLLSIVRNRLDQLFDRLGRPTGPEILKLLEKFTTGTYKQFELTQAAARELRSLTAHQSGPFIRKPAPAEGPDLIVSIAVLGRMLQLLALRLMSGSHQKTDSRTP